MTKYKLIGVTEYAENSLSPDDLKSIREMIGCEIEESEERAADNGILFIMPDGQDTHISFLQIEPIPTPESTK